jgi:predicted molibdopterin-dependent oxidoreductase YjgC
MPDEVFPLLLNTGRSLFQYHTGTMTRKSKGLNAMLREERVEIHPEDAKRLGITDSEMVKVISRRGEVTARSRITDVTPVGSVYMTFHFAESPANRLTNPAYDRVTQTPEYKACAVRVEKLTEAANV